MEPTASSTKTGSPVLQQTTQLQTQQTKVKQEAVTKTYNVENVETQKKEKKAKPVKEIKAKPTKKKKKMKDMLIIGGIITIMIGSLVGTVLLVMRL